MARSLRMAALSGLLVVGACGSGTPGTKRALPVTERDFSISAGSGATTAGKLSVQVHNVGPSEHELLIFRTDLPEDRLPLGPDGRVDENGPGVAKVFDTEQDLRPVATRIGSADLTPGRYVLVCNLTTAGVSHYKLGMHAAVTVT